MSKMETAARNGSLEDMRKLIAACANIKEVGRVCGMAAVIE